MSENCLESRLSNRVVEAGSRVRVLEIQQMINNRRFQLTPIVDFLHSTGQQSRMKGEAYNALRSINCIEWKQFTSSELGDVVRLIALVLGPVPGCSLDATNGESIPLD